MYTYTVYCVALQWWIGGGRVDSWGSTPVGTEDYLWVS